MSERLSSSDGAAEIPEECLAVVRHLWDLLDEELSDAQADRLRRHIGACDICRRYHLYQENFLEALATYRTRYGAPSRVKAKVLESLRGVGFVEAG